MEPSRTELTTLVNWSSGGWSRRTSDVKASKYGRPSTRCSYFGSAAPSSSPSSARRVSCTSGWYDSSIKAHYRTLGLWDLDRNHVLLKRLSRWESKLALAVKWQTIHPGYTCHVFVSSSDKQMLSSRISSGNDEGHRRRSYNLGTNKESSALTKGNIHTWATISSCDIWLLGIALADRTAVKAKSVGERQPCQRLYSYIPSMPSIDLSIFLFMASDACSRAAFANKSVAIFLMLSLSCLFFSLRSSDILTSGSGNVYARKGPSLSKNEGLMSPKLLSITMKGDMRSLIEPKRCEKPASPMLSSLRQGIDMNKLFSVILKAISHETRFTLCTSYEREEKSV